MIKLNKVFFVFFFKAIHKSVINLEPASVEEELQHGENRDVHVYSVIFVSLLRVQKLSANHAESKKGVNCNSDDLQRHKKQFYDCFISKADHHLYCFVLLSPASS